MCRRRPPGIEKELTESMEGAFHRLVISDRRGTVTARRCTRLIARGVGLESLDETRIATVVAGIVEDSLVGGVALELAFRVSDGPAPELLVTVAGRGRGVARIGLEDKFSGAQPPLDFGMTGMLAARYLLDRCEVASDADGNTVITVAQALTGPVSQEQLKKALDECEGTQDVFEEEFRSQNQELLGLLELLGMRQDEMTQMSNELRDTNRGIVALYGQMEEQATRLRESDETKNRFLSFISHEIRTPLSSIIAVSRLLFDGVDGELNTEQAKQAAMVYHSASSLNGLLSDLLDLARVQAGKVELNVHCFAVAALMSSLRGMMRPIATNPRVELIVEEPVPDLEIWSDETKVTQILRNLVSNALKFTEEGFVRVTVSRDLRAEHLVFAVEDTGIGIAPEDRERIFEEFSQIDHPIQRKVRGTGLGLPLSRRLADLLEGSLEVEGEPGKGSTFRLVLPLGACRPRLLTGSGSGDRPSAQGKELS